MVKISFKGNHDSVYVKTEDVSLAIETTKKIYPKKEIIEALQISWRVEVLEVEK